MNLIKCKRTENHNLVLWGITHINRILSPVPDYYSAHSNNCNILVCSACWITKAKWILSLNSQTVKNGKITIIPYYHEENSYNNIREQKFILKSYPLLFLIILKISKTPMSYGINQWAWSRDDSYASFKRVTCCQHLKPKFFYQFSDNLLALLGLIHYWRLLNFKDKLLFLSFYYSFYYSIYYMLMWLINFFHYASIQNSRLLELSVSYITSNFLSWE